MADLSAQLPTLIRGIYFEGWSPAKPAGERTKRDFVIRVRDNFGYEQEIDTDKAVAAVFKLLDRHISPTARSSSPKLDEEVTAPTLAGGMTDVSRSPGGRTKLGAALESRFS